MFIDVLNKILEEETKRIKLIDELTLLTDNTVKEVCKIADKYGVDRKETVEHFARAINSVSSFPFLKELDCYEQEEK